MKQTFTEQFRFLDCYLLAAGGHHLSYPAATAAADSRRARELSLGSGANPLSEHSTAYLFVEDEADEAAAVSVRGSGHFIAAIPGQRLPLQLQLQLIPMRGQAANRASSS